MPGVLYGPYDERNQNYVEEALKNTGLFPLGHQLILPDGRVYAFALNDATAEVAGRLYQSVVSVADHLNRAADVVRAIDAIVLSATLGATLAAIDIYSEGIAHINDALGESYAYAIARANSEGAAHAAVAASGIITVNLAPGEQVQVALDTTSEMSFTRNRFHAILLTAAPPTAQVAGVSPGVAAASRYYWSQIAGFAAVLGDGTLLAGLPVQASIATAGAVENVKRRVRTGSTTTAASGVGAILEDQDGNETATFRAPNSVIDTNYDISGPISINAPYVGMCIKANASTEEALIDLTLVTTVGVPG